jgi:hypothetical protein
LLLIDRMKKRFGIAILVVGVIALLGFWMSPTKTPPPSPAPQPVAEAPATITPTNIPATNVVPPTPAPTNVAVVPVPTNAPVVTNSPDTNPPPATPIVVATPETNSIPVAPVVTNVPDTNPPPVVETFSASPTNAYSCSMVRNLLTDSFTNNLTDNQEWFYRFRAGYERADFGNAKNTWLLGIKLYYRPQSWRDDLKTGTNLIASLLIPDSFAVVEHAAIESLSDSGNPTTEDGVRVGVGFFWPWLNWCSKAPDDCPDGNLRFSLGPTVNGGVEESTTGSDMDLNWFGYGGVRLAASPDAFVEYAAGENGGLTGLHQQVVGEFPIYRKARSDFRYVVRGLWNTSATQNRDIYELAVMVEFPFEAIEHPSNFRDLIPFIK